MTTKDVSFNRIPDDVLRRWKVVRDVVSGADDLRTDTYLPKLNATDTSDQNTSRNAAYRQRAVWFPATQFTLEGLVGLAFHRDPTSELPTQLDYLTKDADGLGVSLYQQSQHVLANCLSIGRHGLFVDWAEALQHPVIKTYAAESIINWRYSIVDGKASLAMVVLEEEVEDEDGRYGLKMVKQWREVYLNDDGNVEVQVHRETDEGAMVQNMANRPKQPVVLATAVLEDGTQVPVTAVELRSRGKVLTEIPFTFVGANNNDASIDPSPLYGMAQVNLAHFRNSADYEDSVFFCGQVQPWISGLSEQWRDFLQNPYVIDADGNRRYTGQKMYVGSRAPMLLPQGAQFGMAQAQPNMLAKEAMEHKEEQMVKIGARMIEATKANKTATGENNDREATTSVLALCVANVNEAYQRAITFCARFMDIAEPKDGFPEAYKITQDFVSMTISPQLMAELVKSWQAGVYSKNDVRDFYRKMGIIPTERTNEEIDRDLEEEGPALGTVGLDPLGNPAVPAPNGGTPPAGGQPGGTGQPPNGQERRGQPRPPRPARGAQRPPRQGAAQ